MYNPFPLKTDDEKIGKRPSNQTYNLLLLPADFYYEDNTADEELTALPQSNIQVDAFIQQSPEYWIKGDRNVLKKKKLIIADWTLKNWPFYRQQRILALFLQLAKDGFEFYCIEDEQLKRIAESDLDALFSPHFYVLEAQDNDFIKAFTTSKGMASQQCLILDYFTLRQLRAQIIKDLPEGQIPYINCQDLLFKTPFKFHPEPDLSHIKVLHRLPTKAQGYINSFLTSSKDPNEYFKAVENTWSQYHKPNLVTVRHEIQILDICQEFPLNTFSFSQIEIIELRGVAFHNLLPHLTNVKSLHLSDFEPNNKAMRGLSLKKKAIENLTLTRMPLEMMLSVIESLGKENVLQKLTLADCEHDKKYYPLKWFFKRKCNFKNLVSLEIKTYSMPLELLILILSLAVNLRTLHISCQQLYWSPETLSELETRQFCKTFSLKEMTISSNLPSFILNKIIASNNNIRFLKLNHTPFQLSDKAAQHLSNLLTLNVIGTLSGRSFDLICHYARNLRNLDLTDLHSDQPFALKPDLKHLVNLEIAKASCPVEILCTILASTDSLKTLQITESKFHFSRFDYTQFHIELKKVQTLKLANLDCPLSFLFQLLSHTSALKYLQLNYCKFRENFGTPEPLFKVDALANVTELNITASHFSFVKLALLLQKMRNLQTLLLSESKLGDIPPQWAFHGKIQFSRLKRFEAAHSDLTIEMLASILNSAPYLTELYLYQCQRLQGDLTFKQFFQELIVVSLSNAQNVSPKFLLNLLRHGPKLKRVNICDSHSLIAATSQTEFAPYLPILFFTKETSYENEGEGILQSLSHAIRQLTVSTPVSLLGLGNRHSVDSHLDSKHSPQEIIVNKIFYAKPGEIDPDPSTYRIDIFEEIEIKSESADEEATPFELKKAPLNLRAAPPFKWCHSTNEVIAVRDKTEGEAYYAPYKMTLEHNFQSLPSKTANERLTALYIEGISPENIEVQYSDSQNLFYIKTYHALPVKTVVHFAIAVPPSMPPPPWLAEIISHYQKLEPLGVFHSLLQKGWNKLSNKQKYSPEDRVLERIEEQGGACRHLTVAFKQRFKSQYPQIWTRCNFNGCHAFPEVKINEAWIICDLGGIETKLTILEPELNGGKTKCEILVDELEITETNVDIPPIQEEALNPLFMTWKKIRTKAVDLEHYCSDFLQMNGKKILLEMPEGTFNLPLILHLQKKCKQLKRPFYYIHVALDLICSATWIERQGNQGILRPGPGGELHQYLMVHQAMAPFILVNFDNFSANDIVRFNTLLDEERFADGTPLPPKATVVGLYHRQKPYAYTGVDFYSRLDQKKPFPEEIVLPNPLIESIRAPLINEKTYPIELYHSKYWKQKLLGHWILLGDQFFFKEGELLKGIQSGLTLEIRNGPWEREDFQLFWQTVGNIALRRSEGYDWTKLKGALIESHEPNTGIVYVLNPTLAGHFYDCYHYANEKIFAVPGLIERNKGKILEVLVSRDLNERQWAQILNESHIYNVKLKKVTATASKHLSVYISHDIDAQVAILKQEFTSAKVFNISEYKSADLLANVEANWKEDNIRFTFNQRISQLWEVLNSGQTLILHGNFTSELVDNLAPLFIENGQLPFSLEKKESFGKLILVSNKSTLFKFTGYETVLSTVSDKRALLEREFGAGLLERLETYQADILKSYCYTRLHNLLKYLRAKPESDPRERWLGLLDLPKINFPENLDLSLENCLQFEQERLALFENALSLSPYVIISGVTGTGKSTFMQELNENPKYKVYTGESAIPSCLQDKILKKQRIVFIDEANLSNQDYARFENEELLIDGILFAKEDIRFVFALNPLSDGGERNLPSLFSRFGNVIIFPVLPSSYLYHRVIRKLMRGELLFWRKIT